MKLCVVWKSSNEIDVENFIFPYVYNSKLQKWFDDVEVLIWGASQHSVADSSEYKLKIKEFVSMGINVYACKMCADRLGVTETLESLGVNVVYTGVYLSNQLKDPNTEVLTV